MRRRLGLTLALVAVTAGLLAGCTSARGGVGSSDSSCYLALPTASQAVGGHGHFIGVHRFSPSGLKKTAPRMLTILAAGHPITQDICAVGFTGSFTAANVSKPLGKAAGKLAVVVTETGSNRLLGTVIFTKLPLRFSKSHIG